MLGYGRGGQAAVRKHYDGKISTASGGIYGNPKDKSLHGVPEDWLGSFLRNMDRPAIIIKTGLASGDCVLQATISHKTFWTSPTY